MHDLPNKPVFVLIQNYMREYIRQGKMRRKKKNSRNCWVGREHKAVQESETELIETSYLYIGRTLRKRVDKVYTG